MFNHRDTSVPPVLALVGVIPEIIDEFGEENVPRPLLHARTGPGPDLLCLLSP